MRLRWWGLAGFVSAAIVFFGVQPIYAQDDGGDGGGDGKDAFDQGCLSCHEGSDAHLVFGNGDQRSVDFDLDAFNASVHGSSNPGGYLSCYDCHGEHPFPHESGPYPTPRDLRLELNARCEGCHSYEAELASDSVHAAAMAAGNTNAAVCVDCHGYHDVHEPGVPRASISLTCGTCHTDIFAQYKESVHGSALLEESNPDVPTCINCHGVHNISDPTTNLFRIRSPELCASCHANEELMNKYGISTNVFNSYVSDFHGTTVTLFEHQDDPNAEVNKAVCYDCHGVHDIRSPNDPESSVIQDNLLATCQRCHPNATANFPTAWLSHYQPSPDKYPLVYYVNLFYKFFIPGILGFFLVVIIPDAIKRFGGHPHQEEEVVDVDD